MPWVTGNGDKVSDLATIPVEPDSEPRLSTDVFGSRESVVDDGDDTEGKLLQSGYEISSVEDFVEREDVAGTGMASKSSAENPSEGAVNPSAPLRRRGSEGDESAQQFERQNTFEAIVSQVPAVSAATKKQVEFDFKSTAPQHVNKTRWINATWSIPSKLQVVPSHAFTD